MILDFLYVYKFYTERRLHRIYQVFNNSIFIASRNKSMINNEDIVEIREKIC